MSAPRDEMLDVVRGVALVTMTVDHLPFPAIQRLTWEPLGFYSAAVVFVCLSGYVCGWRYTQTAELHGWNEARRKIVKRVLVLLCTFYALVAASAAACVVFPDPWFSQLRLNDTIAAATLQGFLLQRTFYLPAVLKLYVYFLLLLLVCIPLFRRGAGAYVLAASFAGWACVQWFPFKPVEVLFETLGKYFHLLAWQFLFVAAAWLGYARAVGPSFRFLRWRVTAAIAWAAFATGFALRHPRWFFGTPDLLADAATDFHRLAWGSLASFAAAVLCYAITPARYKRRIAANATMRPFALLGRHSLAVFSVHIAVVYVVFGSRSGLAALWPAQPAAVQFALGALVTAPLFATALVSQRLNTMMPLRRPQQHNLAAPDPELSMIR